MDYTMIRQKGIDRYLCLFVILHNKNFINEKLKDRI